MASTVAFTGRHTTRIKARQPDALDWPHGPALDQGTPKSFTSVRRQVEGADYRIGQDDRRGGNGLLVPTSQIRFDTLGTETALVRALAIRDERIDALLKNQVVLETAVSAMETQVGTMRLLVQEAHHRIMNSLQLVSSVVSMTAAGGHRLEADSVLTRIQSIAAVHRQMIASDDTGLMSVEALLRNLCTNVQRSYLDETIGDAFEIEIESGIDFSSGQAPLCALVVNELLTNALKHAGHGIRTTPRRVSLHARREGGGLRIDIVNDVSPDTAAAVSKPGFGTLMTDALVTQLDARIERRQTATRHRVTIWIPIGR